MFNCLCDNTVQKTAVKKKYIVGSGCKSFEKRFRSIEIRIRKTGPRTVICFKEFYTAPQIYKKKHFFNGLRHRILACGSFRVRIQDAKNPNPDLEMFFYLSGTAVPMSPVYDNSNGQINEVFSCLLHLWWCFMFVEKKGHVYTSYEDPDQSPLGWTAHSETFFKNYRDGTGVTELL